MSAKPKRKYSSDSDEESDYTRNNSTLHFEDDEEEGEEGNVEVIAPNVMTTLVQEFIGYVKRNNKEGVMAKYIPRIAADFIKERGEDVDLEHFVKSYKKYLSLANKSMSLKTSSDCLLEFLEKGEVVKFFPGFPKAPPNLLIYYTRKYNIQIGFGKIADAKRKMAIDGDRRRTCERELHDVEKKFLSDLENFIEEKSDELTDHQKTYLATKLKTYKKKIYGPEVRTPKTPAAKRRLEPMTAFDYYLKTVADKYTGLEPEAREKKLRKKFAKLDENVKDVFDKLAMA